ncbi:MAG TPA: hypothetical protein VN436_05930 [Holophaga sp.]|nr:hypothetical protein [Holophaga sp.]
MSELREALEKLCHSTDLPTEPIHDPYRRIMAALWRMAADDFLAEHPDAWEEAQHDGPSAQGIHFLNLTGEAHCWEKYGCSFPDFVFPTFFGAKIQTYRIEDGELAPEEDE